MKAIRKAVGIAMSAKTFPGHRVIAVTELSMRPQ
jgi:hypothetical protein